MKVRTMISLFVITFSISFVTLYAEERERPISFKIIETQSGQIVTWKNVLDRLESHEVVVWGEEHDDTMGHQAQLSFFKLLTERFPTALSLEMLERDQQTTVNEFFQSHISERQFLDSLVLWKNFLSDYFPLLKHAKEVYAPIVCANPPRRYVSSLAKKGMLAYADFSEEALRYIPAAYSLSLFSSEDYTNKLRGVFSSTHGNSSQPTPQVESLILAQFMWDQGMAESVSREIYRSGRKVLQINGRFHSDEWGGLSHRLRQMGHKVVLISAFPEGKEDEKKFVKIADFVILTSGR
ncbi:hypothetical protein LPTSP4_15930 [Leptospira ryugenii]|uniref:Haem-binding uptake Tiki superfamily ChaN domain-containing protein n=1 Tax=Leptospira ryugenii TaxID=1917863 RepID=A0A2P2DZL3_9LEPT|nr:ChaN family lipoprotein [Leptospira ryugenii]GBF50070.1 hypothetical protein LPTSP4_15930 [Leptospira ryugenii]